MVWGGDIYIYQSIWEHFFTTCPPILFPQQVNGQGDSLLNSRGRWPKQGLKEQKKAICCTFPSQFGVFALHDFGHAFKEAEIMKSMKLTTFVGRQCDPNNTTKDFTTMVKVKPFTHEEDAFNDLFLQKGKFSEVTHMASLLFTPYDVKAFHVYIRGDY